jgi:hypothetical protein
MASDESNAMKLNISVNDYWQLMAMLQAAVPAGAWMAPAPSTVAKMLTQ